MSSNNILRPMTPLILGGAGFSYQLTSNPESIPLVEILEAAFESGIRAIDTSPYYEPSEQLLGQALNDERLRHRWKRDDYCILTKVGRVTATHLDYSPSAVSASVLRSLQRFKTSYLDVVFAHDVELVTQNEALGAVRTLFEMADRGLIRHVGISGYDIDVLANIAMFVKQHWGRSIHCVQTWAQLTLQNTQMEQGGFESFRNAGVRLVCCSSPLGIGLLSDNGVPIGGLGDWHPAPSGLRARAQEAANLVSAQDQNLASLALRHAIRSAQRYSAPDMLVTTICGVSSLVELQQNAASVAQALGLSSLRKYDRSLPDEKSSAPYDLNQERADALLCQQVRTVLGDWIDFDFSKQAKAPKSEKKRNERTPSVLSSHL